MLRRVRHRKSDGIYWVLGVAELQSSGGPVKEGATLTIYRGQKNQLWVRPTVEFEDGRFIEMPAESGAVEPPPLPQYIQATVYNQRGEKTDLMFNVSSPRRAGFTFPASRMTDALMDVIMERNRQLDDERFSYKHDDAHTDGQIARAAAAYALSGSVPLKMRGSFFSDVTMRIIRDIWTWEWKWWKPSTTDPRRDLVKAGALIIAEIERLDRAAAR